ncbi:putative enoyl-CoA hydratase echA8 [mine drainage metagenome]|uniref:3-hydroxyisobutyryl-CoA hydrolase n=1 Tax=mine drainage metagenome TaxID=410659 RepID=A0A1J5RAL9_9ZZZZ
MTSDRHIQAEIIGRLGRITLTRPAALNALTRAMIVEIHAQLRAWQTCPEVEAVLLRGEGRAFCAGGDIKAVWEAVGRGAPYSGFFWDEYLLDHAIHVYPKPVISLLDGFVMGGGAGISMLGSHRVATERTAFAMPETAIGFYPDAGGTFFLSRLPLPLARYLGMTGARIDGADCAWCGLATHYIPSARLAQVEAELAAEGAGALEVLLSRHRAPPPESALSGQAAAIDRSFGVADLPGILANLAAETGDWAETTRAHVATLSPTCMALTLRQLETGRGLSLAQALVREYRMSLRMALGNDFREGVRAKLVERGYVPRWRQATADAVAPAALDALFAPLDQAELPL